MKKNVRKLERKRRSTPVAVKALKWLSVIGVVALVVYGVTQMSGVAYNEDAIKVVNFSNLDPAEKKTALQTANNARCTCSCGMTLAQCVSIDSTCPVRESNIERIKTIVREADKP